MSRSRPEATAFREWRTARDDLAVAEVTIGAPGRRFPSSTALGGDVPCRRSLRRRINVNPEGREL